MNLGQTVFAQLMEFIPTYDFQLCVDRYQGNRYIKEFSCWDQFLCLALAQRTDRHSLRDSETCLRAQRPKLYPMGFRGQVSRTTRADAHEVRDGRIYRDCAQVLIAMARDLYREAACGVDGSETVYAVDSTTVDWCLSLFPWAQFRRRKSTVKLHTLLDVRGSIPTSVYVTGGRWTRPTRWASSGAGPFWDEPVAVRCSTCPQLGEDSTSVTRCSTNSCSMKFQLRRNWNFNRSREGKSLPEDLTQQVKSTPNFGFQD